MNYKQAIFLGFVIYGIPLYAFDPFKDIERSIRNATKDVGRSIEKAAQDTGKTLEKASKEIEHEQNNNGELSKAIEEAKIQSEQSYRNANEQLEEINYKVSELAMLAAQISAERENLANERDLLTEEKRFLTKEKSEIEQREKLFSMGFYATLSTSIIAILGLVVRIPNSRLDRKLRLLEIEAKALEIETAKKQSEKQED